MKCFKLIVLYSLFSLFLISGAAMAAPYYVGDNPTPEQRASLGVEMVPTDKFQGRDEGVLMGLELRGAYDFRDYLVFESALPFFMASSDTTGGQGTEAGIGNIPLSVVWNRSLESPVEGIRWGYWASGDVFIPTARDVDSALLAFSNPSTQYQAYTPGAFSLQPTAGLYASGTYWSAKTNLGYTFSHLTKESFSGDDKNRNALNYQLGASGHPTGYLNINLEYNLITLDERTSAGGDNIRHQLTPSVSGEWRDFAGSLYTSFPIDDSTQDRTAIVTGFVIAYQL